MRIPPAPSECWEVGRGLRGGPGVRGGLLRGWGAQLCYSEQRVLTGCWGSRWVPIAHKGFHWVPAGCEDTGWVPHGCSSGGRVSHGCEGAHGAHGCHWVLIGCP